MGVLAIPEVAKLIMYAVIGGGVLIAIWYVYSPIRKSAKQEVIIESQEAGLDAVQQAKRVEEAARSGTDPEWSKRVRDKYRRP